MGKVKSNLWQKEQGPTGIWTRIDGFKVHSDNHYTIGPSGWRIRVSIPVPHACKARTLPIELIPHVYVRRIIIWTRSKNDFSSIHIKGRLAQLVEHWSNKPRVAGSSPVVTTPFFLNWIIKKKFRKERCTSSGDRTHDHKIKSLALYHLSYGGVAVGEHFVGPKSITSAI